MHDGEHTETGDERDRRIGRRALAIRAEAIDAFSDGEQEWIAATGNDWQDDVPAVEAGDTEDDLDNGGPEATRKVTRTSTNRDGDPPAD